MFQFLLTRSLVSEEDTSALRPDKDNLPIKNWLCSLTNVFDFVDFYFIDVSLHFVLLFVG